MGWYTARASSWGWHHGALCFSIWVFRGACWSNWGGGMWRSVRFRNQICCGALYIRWGGCWRFDRYSHGNSVKFVASVCFYFGKLATIRYELSFPGTAGDGPCFSEAGDVSTEAEVRHMRRRKQAVITRRLVPLWGQEPGPVDAGSRERSRVIEWCWSRPLTMVIVNSNEDTLGLDPCGFLICWIV